MPRNVFRKCRGLLGRWRSAVRDSALTLGELKYKAKVESKFPEYAGFLLSKDPATRALFRLTTEGEGIQCIFMYVS